MINSLHVCRLCISKVIQITRTVFSAALPFLRFDLFLMSQDLLRSEIRLDYLLVNICNLCEDRARWTICRVRICCFIPALGGHADRLLVHMDLLTHQKNRGDPGIKRAEATGNQGCCVWVLQLRGVTAWLLPSGLAGRVHFSLIELIDRSALGPCMPLTSVMDGGGAVQAV